MTPLDILILETHIRLQIQPNTQLPNLGDSRPPTPPFFLLSFLFSLKMTCKISSIYPCPIPANNQYEYRNDYSCHEDANVYAAEERDAYV